MDDESTAETPPRDADPGSRRRATFRLARPDDNAALCALLAASPMPGDVCMTQERSPDFFAFYDLQQADARVLVGLEAEQIMGVGAYLGRDGYLCGERARVGYACDLRRHPSKGGGFVLARMLTKSFQDSCEAFGCEVMYTAIIASNQIAQRNLVQRTRRHPKKPVYRHLRSFDIVSALFTRRGRPRPTDLRVTRATEGELDEIEDRLARDHAQRPFGYVFGEGLVRERLGRWPRLAPESFYLARSAAGKLRGVVAAWDPHEIKRFRVVSYEGSMRWVRRAYALAAFALRFPPLPNPGEVFKPLYLTHQSVVDDDPAVMAALVDRIYQDHYDQGFHYLTAPVYENDPLRPAFRGYLKTELPAQLYAMCAPGSRCADDGFDFGPGRPGFEMALV